MAQKKKTEALGAELPKRTKRGGEFSARAAKLESTLHQECESAGSLRHALDHKRALAKDAAALTEARTRLQKSEEAHKAAGARVKEFESGLAKAEEAQSLAQESWVKGQAHSSRRPARGDACPVCGSHEHPALASAAHGEEPKFRLAAREGGRGSSPRGSRSRKD